MDMQYVVASPSLVCLELIQSESGETLFYLDQQRVKIYQEPSRVTDCCDALMDIYYHAQAKADDMQLVSLSYFELHGFLGASLEGEHLEYDQGTFPRGLNDGIVYDEEDEEGDNGEQVCLITTPISSPTKTKPSRIFWNDEDIVEEYDGFFDHSGEEEQKKQDEIRDMDPVTMFRSAVAEMDEEPEKVPETPPSVCFRVPEEEGENDGGDDCLSFYDDHTEDDIKIFEKDYIDSPPRIIHRGNVDDHRLDVLMASVSMKETVV